jgi:hypothetical protein
LDQSIIDVYERLSEFELIEAFYLVRSTTASDISLFMTALFAYITAAAFVASRLSTLQLLIVSILYSWFSFMAITGVYTQSTIGAHINYVLYGDYWKIYYMGFAVSISLVIAWIVSLAFMAHSRKRPDILQNK